MLEPSSPLCGTIAYDAGRAAANTPAEFLALCGTVGLGRLLRDEDVGVLPLLRTAAADPRWRVREGVAMALQLAGEANMNPLLTIADEWSKGTHFEQRAAIAALCEPRLLHDPPIARSVLTILDRVTATIPTAVERKSEGFRALRKALGYCWSVAVAALPEEGKPCMARWFGASDPDISWIMRENLKKQRLLRMDADWVEQALATN